MTAHLKIQCHFPEMEIPQRAHSTDAGIDLTAYSVEPKNYNVFLFNTGISLEISTGYYVEIVPRSSIIKTEFVMANSVGVIDPDYRGIIKVPLRYIGSSDAYAAAQSMLTKRIAQLLIRRWEPCTWEVVDSLSSTKRGTNGFGSTG